SLADAAKSVDRLARQRRKRAERGELLEPCLPLRGARVEARLEFPSETRTARDLHRVLQPEVEVDALEQVQDRSLEVAALLGVDLLRCVGLVLDLLEVRRERRE